MTDNAAELLALATRLDAAAAEINLQVASVLSVSDALVALAGEVEPPDPEPEPEPGPDDLILEATDIKAPKEFDLDRFGAEVDRVCRHGAVVAMWSYGLFRVEAAIDAIVGRFYRDVVGPYWPPERRLVDEEYRTLPFRWPEIAAPRFAIETALTLEGVLAYVHTWSAVQGFIRERGFDPVPGLGDELGAVWNGPRPVRFELALRVGRVG